MYIHLIIRYIKLDLEEIQKLEHIQKNGTNDTARKRSQCLLLSHQKYTITELSKLLKTSRQTIERWYNAWEKNKYDSLVIAKGRGVKTKLKRLEKEIAKELEVHGRNLKNVLHYVEKEHSIKICKKTLQNFLKGTGL